MTSDTDNLDGGLRLRGVPECNFTQEAEAAVALLCRMCRQLLGIPLQQSCPSTGPTLPRSGVIALTMVLKVTVTEAVLVAWWSCVSRTPSHLGWACPGMDGMPARCMFKLRGG